MKTLDKTILNVKLSKELKQDAQDLAHELGVPLSTIVVANLKEFVRSRSFNVTAHPRLKPEIEREIEKLLLLTSSWVKYLAVFTSPKAPQITSVSNECHLSQTIFEDGAKATAKS